MSFRPILPSYQDHTLGSTRVELGAIQQMFVWSFNEGNFDLAGACLKSLSDCELWSPGSANIIKRIFAIALLHGAFFEGRKTLANSAPPPYIYSSKPGKETLMEANSSCLKVLSEVLDRIPKEALIDADERGMTLLHHSIGHCDTIAWMISKRREMSTALAVDSLGETPLHYAMRRNCVGVCKMLMILFHPHIHLVLNKAAKNPLQVAGPACENEVVKPFLANPRETLLKWHQDLHQLKLPLPNV